MWPFGRKSSAVVAVEVPTVDVKQAFARSKRGAKLVDVRSAQEFAHSGHPATDLGNLLRFDRHPAYLSGLVSAWCERRGSTPAEALDLARAADLWALVDLAARAGENPVADRAAEHLRAIAETGDIHAVPA